VYPFPATLTIGLRCPSWWSAKPAEVREPTDHRKCSSVFHCKFGSVPNDGVGHRRLRPETRQAEDGAVAIDRVVSHPRNQDGEVGQPGPAAGQRVIAN
jgi:hypothetical protein